MTHSAAVPRRCYLCDWPEVVERGDHGQWYCRDHSRGDKPLRPATTRTPIEERRWQLRKRAAMRAWVPLTPLTDVTKKEAKP